MRQLPHSDALFLASERAHANSNVSLIQLYDPSTAPGGRLRFKSILKLVESRLHLSPIFRQRPRLVPFGLDDPYWIEDERFDLEYHVRNIALPKPGDWRQFCIQASRIHARPLDPNRPLWEIYVIERLDSIKHLPRDSFALLTKLHHAAIDVERGTEIITLLHDTSPIPAPAEPPEPWFPASAPGDLELVLRAAAHALRSPARLARPLAAACGRVWPVIRSFANELARSRDQVPFTRFNSVVSPYRVFETRRFRLQDFGAIRRLVRGATVNDAVLAVCSGALRRYLEANDELPAEDLWGLTPVYVREAAGGPDAKPQVEWVRLRLGVDREDPLERLAFIRRQTAASPTIRRAIGARELTDLATHAPAATLALTGKMLGSALLDAERGAPLANCAITNVPGPSTPLYLDGARMTYFSAIMPIDDGLGLAFAVTSYDGRLMISPTSCREQMPDPETFARCVRAAFEDYRALARDHLRVARAPAASAIGTGGRAGRQARKAPTVPLAVRAGPQRSRARAR